MHRLFHPLLALVASLSLLAACAAPPTPTPAATAVPATSAPATDAPAATPTAAAFPVTIEHKYGSTEITAAPERVVVVGLVEQDAFLALGVVPVATREWYGERPGAIFTWALDELGDSPVPEVMAFELDFEKIALLRPDVIVGLYSGLTQEEYDTLSQIAPTVAQPAEYVDWGIPWQELTRKVGLIVGQGPRAEALVEAIDTKFEAVRAEHPEFAEATGAMTSSWGYPESYYVYSSQDVRGRILTGMGIQTLDEFDELAGAEFGATISRERLDMIDLDVIIWIGGLPDEARDDPVYQQLAVAQEGRDLLLGESDPLYDALNFGTVLSLDYAIDELVPRLIAALDGDPATVPTGGQPVAAFPVTIDHKFGSTTLESKPERIVLVGLVEQDALLALGEVPIATREWWGERPGAIFEWATDDLGEAELPVVLSGVELDFEQISGLEPDVIVGLYAGLTQEEYDTLSQIAPTVAQPAEHPDWGIPWTELTLTIGKIVGKQAQAEALIADVEARFAEVREQHPEFAGAIGLVGSPGGTESYWIYSSSDPRGQFLTQLGFEPLAEADELAGEEFGVSISRERMNLLNEVGAVVWMPYSVEALEAVRADPLYQQTVANREGRDIFVHPDDTLSFAFSFSSVLSLPFVIDHLVPQLAAAVDGDPATVVTP